jgi:acyl carrier protein
VGEVETALANIWADVLQVAQVGRHDHFFDLGGHSLLSTKMLARVEQEFGVDISFSDFFKEPLLTSMAKQVVFAQLAQFAPEDIDALVSNQQ